MKNLKKQNGITLIALAITIAIMIILVAVTIRVSLKGGLFSTAKEATGIKQIAQEKEQLLVSAIRSKGRDGRIDFTALDNDLPDGFSKIAEGTYESEAGNKYEVTDDGTIILLEQNGEDGLEPDIEEPTVCAHTNTRIESAVSATCTTDGHTGRTICVDCGKVLSNGNVIASLGHTTTDGVCDNCGNNMSDSTTNHDDIIPEGGTYTTASGDVYTEGSSFPSTVTTGDKYIYGNYEYHYNQYCQGNKNYWYNDTSQNGWSVRCVNNVANPGVILESINNKTITDMQHTFDSCTQLTVAPAIPETVKDLTWTFGSCYFLTTAPSIPNGVTDMLCTFRGCTALVDVSNLIIPSSVTHMGYTFKDCTSLIGNLAVDANPTLYYGCLENTGITTITGICSSTTRTNLLGTK